MNITYKMKTEAEQQVVHNCQKCGMLSDHSEALYIQLKNGIEMFIPLASLDWYGVKDGESDG